MASIRSYLRCLKTDMDKIVTVKEDEWRSFVRENKDDPWGKVYRICRGRKRQVDYKSLQVDNTTLSSWRECALLGVFFPRTESIGYSPPPVKIVDLPNLKRTNIEDCFCKIKRNHRVLTV